MSRPSHEQRLLGAAEEALVRDTLTHPGRISPGDEGTLRHSFALARLSLSAATRQRQALSEFKRVALGTVHALFGELPEKRPAFSPEVARLAAKRLWPLAVAARDLAGGSARWEAATRRRSLLLALGGGGGVGHVYLGCFALLEEWGLRPELIAGTSFGAVLGLFRAQHVAYHSEDLPEILEALTFRRLFRLFRVRSQYALPGPLGLYLRTALLPVLLRLASKERSPASGGESARKARSPTTFADLAIPLVVTVAGIRTGMLPRPPREYERLLNFRSFFPPTPRKIQSRVQDLLAVLGEFVRQPHRLDALYLGADEGTRGFDVLDAIGFSCSLPGFIHYDVLREDPAAHARIRALLDERELAWLADGGLVENCPARAAYETFHGRHPESTPPNSYVLALDAFSPKLSTAPWLPLQRLAHETVRRARPYANLYLPFPRTLSPLSVLPTRDQAARAITFGRAQLAPHMPFLARMLGSLPTLESSRPAA